MNTITKIILSSLSLGITPIYAVETIEEFKASVSERSTNEIRRIFNHYVLAQLNPTQHVPDCGLCVHLDTNEPYTSEDLTIRIATLKLMLAMPPRRAH